jgi:hypothetical protein
MGTIRRIIGADYSGNPNAFVLLSNLAASYQVAVLATGGTITNGDLNAVATYIDGSVSDGTWARHSLFAPFAGNTYNAARVAINQSGAVTLSSTGTAIYSPAVGVTTTNDLVVDLGLSPAAMGHTTSSAAIGAYFKNGPSNSILALATPSGSSNIFGISPGNDNTTRFMCNDYGSAANTTNTANSRLIGTRQATNVSKIFKNGALANTASAAPTPVVSGNVRITPEYGGATGAVIGCVMLFNGALSDIEVTRIDARMAALILALGR